MKRSKTKKQQICPNCHECFDIGKEIRPFAYHSCNDGKVGCVKIN